MGCDTIHAAGDADFLIGQSAVSVSATRDTVVIADDTDILILFCHQTTPKRKFSSNHSRNEGPRKARFGTSKLLVLCSGQTSAGIFHFYTRCWDVVPRHGCLVLERPSVLRRDHSCNSMPKYFIMPIR